jgi:hypothetical protein
MADIVIRRCTLRVTRHGGWSWGCDRGTLIERVTRLLPELIAARLADLLGDSEAEIAEPLRLRVALGAAAFANPARLKAAIDAMVTPDCLLAAAPALAAAATERRARAAGAGPQPAVTPTLPGREDRGAQPSSLRALLLRWRSQGDLALRVRGFPEAAASLWLGALLDECRETAGEAPAGKELPAEIRAIVERLPASFSERPHVARARLIAAVELTARHPRLPDPAAILRLLDRVLPTARGPGGGSAPASTGRDPAGPAARTREAAEAEAVHGLLGPAVVRRADKPAGAEGDVALASVLPFLALSMLRRIGWLDAAAATFQSLALPDHGAIFAAALAGKLLPPPERGWRRTERALRTIAIFAGLETAPSPVAVEAWSRTAGEGLGALDGFVAFEIANGHDAALPLLVTRAGTADSPWLLFDADGFYPVACAPDEGALLAALLLFCVPILLAPPLAAPPRLMRDLRAADFAFATDAPPARGEAWTRLPGLACWASPGDVPLPRVAAAALRLAELEAAAAATCRELLALRPAVAPGKATALDETAALGAALALGLLAWSLWRGREPVDPLLALERLGDLDGTARLTPDALEVRPAIGRRYLDLKAHDLLADIEGVPWLDGRIIRFVGP